MSILDENLLKEELRQAKGLDREANGCCTTQSVDEPARPCLRERVRSQRMRAEGEVSRAMALAELEHLLAKHPDVARILDLAELLKW